MGLLKLTIAIAMTLCWAGAEARDGASHTFKHERLGFDWVHQRECVPAAAFVSSALLQPQTAGACAQLAFHLQRLQPLWYTCTVPIVKRCQVRLDGP